MPESRGRRLGGVATVRALLVDNTVALVVALIVAAVSVTALLNHPQPADPRPVDWAVTVVVPFVLLSSRRAAAATAWGLFALAWLASFALRTPVIGLTAVAALYPLARARGARQAVPAAAAGAASIAVFWLRDGNPWMQLWAVAALLAAIVLAGLNARTRQAYLASLDERAHRLEVQRDQQAQLAAADERTRIAREMHDIVAHHLTVIVSLSDAAAMTAAARPERAATTMQQVAGTGRQALGDLRRLLGVLRTADGAPHGPQPGVGDLDELAASVRAAGVPVQLIRHGEPGSLGLAADLAVYRIVQEALTNVLKHAGPAATATVTLTYRPDGATVEVRDTGTGRLASGSGAGLVGMRERVAAYGGELLAGPQPGGGWRVRAELRVAG